MEMTPEIFWLAILIILAVVEIATVGLFTIWFAAGALLAEVIAWFNAPIWLQVTVFIVVSVLMLVYTRPFAMKYINKDRTKTNIDSMIGKQAIVTKRIDNLKGEGQAVFQGMEWTARSELDDRILEAETIVEIRAISGVKLIVAPVEE